MHKISVICLLLVAVIAYLVLCEEEVKSRCRRRRFRGCSLENHHCVCKDELACHNPFPYRSRWECRKDRLGKYDKCLKNHCENDGVCLQVKNYHNNRRTYHCDCTATGYYGKRCEKECPKMTSPMKENYPVACIFEF